MADYSDLGFEEHEPYADLGFEPHEPAPKSEAKKADISKAESFGRGAAQGATMGFGDELSGAIQAIGEKYPFLSPLAIAAHLSSGRPLSELVARGTENAERPAADIYRENRDQARAVDEAAQKANPGAYLAGDVGGSLITAPLVPGGAAKTLPKAIAAGMALGSVGGLGSSRADLTRGEYGQAAVDTGVGGVVGGAAGAGGYLASQFPKTLSALGTKLGRRAIGGGSAAKKVLSEDVIKEAVDSGAIRPFSGSHAILERLGEATKNQGEKVGGIIERAGKRGIKGPDATELAVGLLDETGGEPFAEAGRNPRVNVFRQAAKDISNEPTDASGRLGLKQAEDIKRLMQTEAKREYSRLPGFQSPEGAAHVEAAERVKSAVEREIERQAHLAPEEAAAFVPAKEKYGRLAKAFAAATAGANKHASHAMLDFPEELVALGEIATGEPGGAAKGIGAAALHSLLKSRGPSTGAWASFKLADALRAAQRATQGAPGLSSALPLSLGAALGANRQ